MYKKKSTKKFISLATTLLIILAILAGCNNDSGDVGKPPEDSNPVESEEEANEKNDEKTSDSTENSEEYLKEFFEISFDKEVSKKDMNSALEKFFGDEASLIDGDLNGPNLIKAINESSGFKELSLTYSDDKAKESLKENDINEDMEADLSKYIASTIDSNTLNADLVKDLVSSDEITDDLAVETFSQVLNNSNLGRNYLGYSDDPDIYRKLEDSWNSFILYDDETLTDIGAKLVKEEKITGYNLKLNSYVPDFFTERSLSYGHSNIDHALQLIALINSEDLVAKVQLEPKVSIYEYLPEWGEPDEPTAKYFVDEVGDLLLANAMEYDLNFEFTSTEDLIKFEEVVDEYAKKNEENQGEGLIIESWWQPFLLVSNDEMLDDRFFEMYDISLSNDDYTLRSAVLEEDKDAIENEFSKLGGSTKVEVEKKYTNKAFYDYLQGIDYQ
ncbi:MAG: hypothetical protein ACTHW2_11675 [Tissierella sp.]|uniref:hypothetical protein n=1 Tax=Tissierella sp. TaxID=41274 RepID=UPI003F9842B2